MAVALLGDRQRMRGLGPTPTPHRSVPQSAVSARTIVSPSFVSLESHLTRSSSRRLHPVGVSSCPEHGRRPPRSGPTHG
jgi:hypothetical protein